MLAAKESGVGNGIAIGISMVVKKGWQKYSRYLFIQLSLLTIQPIKNAAVFSQHISGFYHQNLKDYMSFVERIKLSNQILHLHLSIFFRLGIRAILVLKMRIENSNFFFIQSLFNKNYQFMPKIVVLEHWDHFFRIPRVISDQNTLFQ